MKHQSSVAKPTNVVGLLVVLLVLIGFFGIVTDHFFSVRTFRTIANQLPALVVVSVGMTFVLAIAGIDLSVGSVLALGGAILGVLLLDVGLPLWLSVLAALMAGLSCGLLAGIVPSSGQYLPLSSRWVYWKSREAQPTWSRTHKPSTSVPQLPV